MQKHAVNSLHPVIVNPVTTDSQSWDCEKHELHVNWNSVCKRKNTTQLGKSTGNVRERKLEASILQEANSGPQLHLNNQCAAKVMALCSNPIYQHTSCQHGQNPTGCNRENGPALCRTDWEHVKRTQGKIHRHLGQCTHQKQSVGLVELI